MYKCHHDSDIALNEVYHYCSKIFSDPNLIQEESINLATHLYNQSTHPKIKAGEFYVVYFSNCEVDGKCINAIGLFKSENKDTFLKIHSKGENFEIESESGININKLDKGCLIFNTERENGYLVAIVDNTNKGSEAKYWTDDFLHVRPRKDSLDRKSQNSCEAPEVPKTHWQHGKRQKHTQENRWVPGKVSIRSMRFRCRWSF